MSADADVLIIGAGPAGASAAIRLATAGWHVVVIEQQRYPRHKVCGECIGAGSWTLLDELGVGSELRQLAGPDLRRVGWMSADRTLVAQMPACSEGRYRYGRALGRDYLDAALLNRARSLGVTVLQPAKLLDMTGGPGRFDCRYELRTPRLPGSMHLRPQGSLSAAVVIDAHGSWEGELVWSGKTRGRSERLRRSDSELLAFKASFRNARLLSGLLPVIAFNGGYGGMVMANHGRTTLACCIRRDALETCRLDAPGEAAGEAIETCLRRSCHGVAAALNDAQRDGPWMSVGPIRPGMRVDPTEPFLRVGNAAGETHPLIGEGITMALQSAALLAAELGPKPAQTHNWKLSTRIRRKYAEAWQRQFASRLRIARIYAHIAMKPALRLGAHGVLFHLPRVLTLAARMAGKSSPALLRHSLN